MTPKKDEIKWFAQTSDKPYNRHTYRLKFHNGKAIVYDDYEVMRAHWFQWCQTGMLKGVVVEDIKKGF